MVSFVIKLFGGSDEATTSMKAVTLIFGLLSVLVTLWYTLKYFNGYTSICTQSGDPNPTFVHKNVELFVISILAAIIDVILLIGLKKYKSWAYVSASLSLFLLFGLIAIVVFHVQDPNFLCGINF